MVVFLCFGSYVLVFYSLIPFHDKNKFKRTNEAAIGKPLKIANSDNLWTYEAAAYYLPQKRALFFAFFDKTRANTQQVLSVQTGLFWYDE